MGINETSSSLKGDQGKSRDKEKAKRGYHHANEQTRLNELRYQHTQYADDR